MGLIINPRQIIKDGITSLRDVWSSSKVSTELSGKQATLVSGTNIKTINNTSLLGSGDITISGGGGEIPKINMTATTATLDPNKFYVWGEVASLDISLAAETAGIENIYKFQFQSGATATTLTLPSSVKWNNVVYLTTQTTYIITILSNIATIDRLYKVSNLPEGYQQVEYIRCTGTQYLNLGLPMRGDYTVNAQFRGVFNQQWSFGARTNYNQEAYCLFNFDGNIPTNIRINYGSLLPFYSDVRANDANIHTYTLDAGTLKIDGDTLYIIPTNSFITTVPLYIMAVNTNGITSLLGYGDILDFDVRLNGNTLSHTVPCYRIADNVAGLYDIVRDIFLTNAGTGSFIVGPDV